MICTEHQIVHKLLAHSITCRKLNDTKAIPHALPQFGGTYIHRALHHTTALLAALKLDAKLVGEILRIVIQPLGIDILVSMRIPTVGHHDEE